MSEASLISHYGFFLFCLNYACSMLNCNFSCFVHDQNGRKYEGVTKLLAYSLRRREKGGKKIRSIVFM